MSSSVGLTLSNFDEAVGLLEPPKPKKLAAATNKAFSLPLGGANYYDYDFNWLHWWLFQLWKSRSSWRRIGAKLRAFAQRRLYKLLSRWRHSRALASFKAARALACKRRQELGAVLAAAAHDAKAQKAAMQSKHIPTVGSIIPCPPQPPTSPTAMLASLIAMLASLVAKPASLIATATATRDELAVAQKAAQKAAKAALALAEEHLTRDMLAVGKLNPGFGFNPSSSNTAAAAAAAAKK
jgi:hypothetical protein